MKPEFQDIPLVKNDTKKRFEIDVNGHFAFINFEVMENFVALIHTETDPELGSTGATKAVVEKTLHYIEEHQLDLMPYCPYVFAYIKKNPEWKRIVNPRFHKYAQL